MLSVLFPDSKEWHLSLHPLGSFATPRLQIRIKETPRLIARSQSANNDVKKEDQVLDWTLFISHRVAGYPGRQKAMQFIYDLFGNDAIDEICSPMPSSMLLSPLSTHNMAQAHLPIPAKGIVLDISFLSEGLSHYIQHYSPLPREVDAALTKAREQIRFIDQELALLTLQK